MYIRSLRVTLDAPADREQLLAVINGTLLPELREHHALREATVFETKQSLVTVLVFASEPTAPLDLSQRLVEGGIEVPPDRLFERSETIIAAA